MYATIVCSNGTRVQYDWLEKQPFLCTITQTFWHSCNCVIIYFLLTFIPLAGIFSGFAEFQEVCGNDEAQNVVFKIINTFTNVYCNYSFAQCTKCINH